MSIVFSSTKQLAEAIRTGAVSAMEVLEAHLAQIQRHNPALNAVITLDADRARERAREADRALARGEVWGPLHGVPFTLKDAHATAGVRTTTGFPPLADHVPQEDGSVAARLKTAGCILMGKTNVHMMLADPAQTINPIFGRTNNPWNVERTPGGSGGGAAAALASGMTPFEVGTDLSGSIRIPAHFCGLFGLKPTENRVSLAGVIPGLPPPRSVRIMSCVGPMARTAEDLTLLYRIIAGPDGRDTDVQPVPVGDVPKLALKGLRIAFAPTFPGFPVAAEIRDTVEDLARRLARLGAIVEHADLPATGSPVCAGRWSERRKTLRSQASVLGLARRVFKPLLYLAVFLLVPLLVGVVNLGSKWTSESQSANVPAYSLPLPAPASYDPSKKIAVVLSSNYGAEINDFLPTYEILASSGAFNVYALAPERKPLPLVNSALMPTSLDFVPHFSFDEYAKAIGRPPDLIAVPYFPNYTPERDAAVVQWIRANAGPNTTLLGICIGTATVADTGLMDGHTATTNLNVYDSLSSRFPNVKWVRGPGTSTTASSSPRRTSPPASMQR
jgi:Asp-tRNA(Asn)/Glu-tRNA(Gln) amidotransferase A subunit family amidase/putative intracellular protease/amidase